MITKLELKTGKEIELNEEELKELQEYFNAPTGGTVYIPYTPYTPPNPYAPFFPNEFPPIITYSSGTIQRKDDTVECHGNSKC